MCIASLVFRIVSGSNPRSNQCVYLYHPVHCWYPCYVDMAGTPSETSVSALRNLLAPPTRLALLRPSIHILSMFHLMSTLLIVLLLYRYDDSYLLILAALLRRRLSARPASMETRSLTTSRYCEAHFKYIDVLRRAVHTIPY